MSLCRCAGSGSRNMYGLVDGAMAISAGSFVCFVFDKARWEDIA